MSAIKKLCNSISEDLKSRFPSQRATQRRKLSELVSATLMCHSPNLMELSNVINRPIESVEARYNYVERFLKNELVSISEVMGYYTKDLLLSLAAKDGRLFLMIDQSKINDDIELLMISVRVKKRALPIIWLCKETKGAICFNEQKKILEIAKSWIPENIDVLLAGDKFYGSKHLIDWCQRNDWHYRLRLKGNFVINDAKNIGNDQNLKTIDQLKKDGVNYIQKAKIKMGVTTDIGILHDKNHKEPWFIALDSKESNSKVIASKVKEYGKRWGIENMFSDFKSKGFNISDSQIKIAKRLERLILVISIAFHWAVSVGMFVKKNSKEKLNPKSLEGLICLFLNLACVNSPRLSQLIKNHRLYGAV